MRDAEPREIGSRRLGQRSRESRAIQITITLVAAKNGAPVGFLHKLIIDNTGKQLGIQELPQ